MDVRSTFKEHATEWQRGLKWNIDDNRPVSESIFFIN